MHLSARFIRGLSYKGKVLLFFRGVLVFDTFQFCCFSSLYHIEVGVLFWLSKPHCNLLFAICHMFSCYHNLPCGIMGARAGLVVGGHKNKQTKKKLRRSAPRCQKSSRAKRAGDGSSRRQSTTKRSLFFILHFNDSFLLKARAEVSVWAWCLLKGEPARWGELPHRLQLRFLLCFYNLWLEAVQHSILSSVAVAVVQRGK